MTPLTTDPNPNTISINYSSATHYSPPPTRAYNDPNFVEKWEIVALTEEERKHFSGLLNGPCENQDLFIQWIDAAPSFGHLLTYLTILKEELTEGRRTMNDNLQILLSLLMKRVSLRMVCCMWNYNTSVDRSHMYETATVQNYINEFIWNFHCCVKIVYGDEMPDDLFQILYFPNSPSSQSSKCFSFKIYYLSYLLLQHVSKSDDLFNLDDTFELQAEKTLLEHGQPMQPLDLDDLKESNITPEEIGLIINLVNNGFHIDRSLSDDSNALTVLLNRKVHKWLESLPYFCMFAPLFFEKLADAQLSFELECLHPFIDLHFSFLQSGKIDPIKHLDKLINTITAKYSLECVFEIHFECDLTTNRYGYSIKVLKTTGKIQGEDVTSILTKIDNELRTLSSNNQSTVYSVTHLVISENVNPELIPASCALTSKVEIKAPSNTPWTESQKIAFFERFSSCTQFVLPFHTFFGEPWNVFNDKKIMDRMERIDIIADLPSYELEQILTGIPSEKGRVFFSDPHFAAGFSSEMIQKSPNMTLAIANQWLDTFPKRIPQIHDEEISVFTLLLAFCLDKLELHKKVVQASMSTSKANETQGLYNPWLWRLLIRMVKTPELKDSLRKCPEFSNKLMENALRLPEKVRKDDILFELLEHLLNTSTLTKEDLEKQVVLWSSDLCLMIFQKIINKKVPPQLTVKFVKKLIPVATQLCKKLIGNNALKSSDGVESKRFFTLLIDNDWRPPLDQPLSNCIELNISLLKHLKKGIPFLNEWGLKWLNSLTWLFFHINRQKLDDEEQEAYINLFKLAYLDQKNPLPDETGVIVFAMCTYPFLLESLLSQYPTSMSQLEGAKLWGFGIAHAVLTQNPLPINDPIWRQKCVNLLDSLKIINLTPPYEFIISPPSIKAHYPDLVPLLDNQQLTQSLLLQSVKISKKGKITIISRSAAALLTKIRLNQTNPLNDQELKICAAVLLDQEGNVLMLNKYIVPIGQEMVNRIAEHPLSLAHLNPHFASHWVLTAVLGFFINVRAQLESDNQSNETPLLIQRCQKLVPYLYTYRWTSHARSALRTLKELISDQTTEFSIKNTLIENINDPAFLNDLESQKIENPELILELLDACPNLGEKEQNILYKIWKKQVSYLSFQTDTVFPINHPILGRKIINYISRNPTLFKFHQQKIATFLNEFLPLAKDPSLVKPLAEIINKIPLEIPKELFLTLRNYFPDHLSQLLGREIAEKEKAWIQEL